MLAMADRNGNIHAPVIGLAYQARKTVEDTLAALMVLESPDENSTRKDEEGRRAIPIAGGWHLVTHEYYREEGMSEEARMYWRQKKRIYRATSKTKEDSPRMSNCPVSCTVSGSVQKRKRIVKEKPTQLQVEEYAEEIGQPRMDGTAMFLHFEEHGWPKSWRLKIQKWKAFNYLPSQKQGKNGSNGQRPTWSKMTWPKDWQEARRQVRFLESQVPKYPEATERITAIQVQFNLK